MNKYKFKVLYKDIKCDVVKGNTIRLLECFLTISAPNELLARENLILVYPVEKILTVVKIN